MVEDPSSRCTTAPEGWVSRGRGRCSLPGSWVNVGQRFSKRSIRAVNWLPASS